ncbi:Peptidase family M1 [bacterium A37T11]|nr:Peptidase family M1 [bacterium A37T11]
MFWQIFRFEIAYRIRRPATYIYFLVFFILGVLVTATGSSPASEKVFHNAPVIIAQFNVYFSMIMMLVCSAVMGVPLYRDIEHGTKSWYLSLPISKAGYFWGRFLGSLLFVFFIGTSLSSGLFVGTLIGPLFDWVPAERIGPNHLWPYVQPYLTLTLSNLFLSSAIFFGLVASFRDVKVIYTGSILLFIGYLLGNFLVRDVENHNLVKLLDPFATNSFTLTVRYYTPAEKNSVIVPIQGYLLWNRIIWLSATLLIIGLTYWRFSFERFFGATRSKKMMVADEVSAPVSRKALPDVSIAFSKGYYRKIMLNLGRLEFLQIWRDNYFKAILGGGLIFLFIDFWIGDTTYGVTPYPLTVNLMEYKNYNYLVFIFIIIIFYTGEAVHREKGSGFSLINDALPTPNWVVYGAKLLGLSALALFLCAIPLVAGVIVQVLKGYFDFNFRVYFLELFAIGFPQYLQIVILSFAVHILVNNKFAGHAVGLLIWIVMFMLRNYGEMDYNLFFYSYTPTYSWSDMDGISSMASGVFWYNLYWLLFGGILLVFAAAAYPRGVAEGWKTRWKQFRQQFKERMALLCVVFLIGFLAVGGYTYYNVSVLNNYLSSSESSYRQSLYEKKLKKFQGLLQPKVISIVMKADIYPQKRKVLLEARIPLVNKTDSVIRTLHLDGAGLTEYSITWNGESLTASFPLIYERGKFNFLRNAADTSKYRIYTLAKPMSPGDTAILVIHSTIDYTGFGNNGLGTDILHNGTFYAGGLPTIGYDPGNELNSDEKRKKYKLPAKEEEYPSFDDPKGIRTLLFNDDADLVSMDITVGTSAGQIAIAPGKLEKKWEEKGRNYYRYIQKSPKVDLFFDVVSASYATKYGHAVLPSGKKIPLELYYHAAHTANLDRFLAAFKDGIAYYSQQYGDFQFPQMRLLEFPKYRMFAQSFPNTVSYSEAFGFTADFRNPDKFDYAYFVTAHELAHQWWGHQVVPNYTRGSNLISEALAEYTALILTQRKYGKDNMKRFLKNELDDYLRGRANEAKKENTFIDCNRPYQWYNKGSLILYGLQDLIGVDTLNKALREFREKFAFREEPPFAGSHDLYDAIARHVPDSLTYYLEDTWRKITLYDNRILDVRVTPAKAKGEYEVTLKVSTKKFYADAKGNEKPASNMADYIDIGVFAAETQDSSGRRQTNPLFLKKYKLQAGEHELKFRVKGQPVKVGIDPYLKLIDRISDDNVKDI